MKKKNSIRSAAMSAMLIGAIAFGVLSAPAANAAPVTTPSTVSTVVPATTYADPFTKQTFDLMNAERAKVGARPLVYDQNIANVSQDWSQKLGVATKDPNFDWANIHRTDAGGSLIPKGATMYREIIGFNFSPSQIVSWWMNSPGHKAAMLDPRLTSAGLGVTVPTSGPYAGWNIVVSNLAAYPNVPMPGPTYAFNDIASAGFTTEITWMKTSGITTGYSDGSFRPYEYVAREQMAAFLYRLAGSPTYTPPAVSPFVDVPTNHVFYKEISWMRSTGISTGWSDGTYRPYEPVMRESMAAFMNRFAVDYCKVNVPATRYFTDANTSVFAPQISWMGGNSISTGWADGTYRPFQGTERKDMAAFVYRLNNHIVGNGGCKA